MATKAKKCPVCGSPMKPESMESEVPKEIPKSKKGIGIMIAVGSPKTTGKIMSKITKKTKTKK
jgi:hypothetical protein